MTTEIKTVKLTKSGLPDKRHETSKKNISKAQMKVKEILQTVKKAPAPVFEFDSDSSDDEEEEDEEVVNDDHQEVEPIPEPEPIKPKGKSKKLELLEQINERLEKLIFKPEVKEEENLELKKEKVVEKVKESRYKIKF